MMKATGARFERLVEIMAKLRSPEGCPWDREQTFQTITPHTLEEAHEVVDAIERQDFDDLCEELGDLLLQIVFYAQMASEAKRFHIDDVLEGVCEKLVHRHPHVFGDAKAKTSDEVLKNWEALKREENKKNGEKRSILGGVPKALPALLKASRLGEKTARVGFDWTDAEGILAKVEEEARELHEARQTKDPQKIDAEFGDLLFTLANCGRFLKVDPEGSLRRSTDRFLKRFQWMEEELSRQQKEMKSLSAAAWEELWSQSKQKT